MNINRLRSLCIEIYKTINGLNPSFMKNNVLLVPTINVRRYVS